MSGHTSFGHTRDFCEKVVIPGIVILINGHTWSVNKGMNIKINYDKKDMCDEKGNQYLGPSEKYFDYFVYFFRQQTPGDST